MGIRSFTQVCSVCVLLAPVFSVAIQEWVGDSGTGEWGPQLALMEPVVGTGKKQEHEYLYNTVSGGAKCSNLGGGKSGKETMEG